MNDANAVAARAIVAVMRRALSQNEETPEDELLSFRFLCEVTLPVLEQIAGKEASN